ncbi:hypothetical protein [Streptomyces sp. NPDC005476]|uniref:hypothetical protein n=1 Tax=Streptomyces sp. NPDC005476 TaxID=3156882 RepID=UPI00345549A6
MARPSRYPLELRRRAVRMVAEVRDDHPNETAALQAVADKLDILRFNRSEQQCWLRAVYVARLSGTGTPTS